MPIAQELTALIAGGRLKDNVFRAMVEALPVAIYTTDAEGRLTYFNKAAVKLSGRSPEIGTDQWCVTWKIFLPDGTFLPHDQCPMAVALRGSEVPTGVECMAERPDGTRFWFSPAPAVVRDADGKIIGGINLLMDITDRKNAEIEASEHFRAVVETTPECVKIVASDGTLLFMNAPGFAMVGARSAQAVIGSCIYDLIAEEDRDRFRATNQQVCRGEKASLEFDMIGLDGMRRNMETHAAPLRHTDGTIVHVAITRDVTERRRAERDARLLSAIVASSDDAIISKNLDGVITSWNKAAERLFGYTPDEAIGRTIAELLIPDDRQDEEPRILARLRRGERIDHFETVRKRKDGTLFDISLTISPVEDGQGRIIGASKIARDISERKQQEARLRKSEERFRALVMATSDVVYQMSSDWTEMRQLVGREFIADTLEPSQSWLDKYIHTDDQPYVTQAIQKAIQSKSVFALEHRVIRTDGTLGWTFSRAVPIVDEAGDIVEWFGAASDITNLKNAEAAIQESEKRFRLLAETGPQIVWVCDARGELEFVNRRWVEFSGLDLAATKDPAQIASRLHPDDHFLEHWGRSVTTGTPFEMEARLRGKDHEFRWFLMRSVPVKDEQGRVERWFGTLTDIHETKLLQLELQRANRDLEQFAYSASHDLQEPLRTVKIYSELLTKRYRDKLDGEASRFVTYLRNGATRMETLLRDLLAYSQVANLERPAEMADAQRALADALSNLTSAISETGAVVTSDPLPSVPVHSTHLEQLFQNLIGNAIKYRSPERAPAVHVAAKRHGGNWVFAVTDNGIGIDSEYNETIFGLFKRLHTNDEYAGTGIGLALCQRIVDRYHGRIWVESEPGLGSTFRFTLPAE
jgi:PAS domain S-box-containing protein